MEGGTRMNVILALDVLAHWGVAAPFLGLLYAGARMWGRS
jgi:hypothetical protein